MLDDAPASPSTAPSGETGEVVLRTVEVLGAIDDVGVVEADGAVEGAVAHPATPAAANKLALRNERRVIGAGTRWKCTSPQPVLHEGSRLGAMQNTPRRLIVPDLARGMALLGIAMANAAQAWIINDWSEDTSRAGWSVGGVRPDNFLDQVCAVFAAMFVHVRGLPMFNTLLGFGFGLVVASLFRKGYTQKEARRVLVRRYGILALFGLIHLFLLFFGDIMLSYGLVGVVMAFMLKLSTKRLRRISYWILGIFATLGVLGTAMQWFFEFDPTEIGLVPTAELVTVGDYFSANLQMAVFVVASLPFQVLQLAALAMLGFVWAQEGVLTNVDAHRKTLKTWTWIAVAIIVLIGVPWGLTAAGVLPSRLETTFFLLNQALGYFTGPGILAAFALATDSLRNEVPGWARAFVALGKRSMSGYLAQSFLFIALVVPAFLGLGNDTTVSGKIGIGILVWFITLLLAVALEAAGKQGPFEWAHRHLSYGKTGRIEPKQLQPENPR